MRNPIVHLSQTLNPKRPMGVCPMHKDHIAMGVCPMHKDHIAIGFIGRL